MATTILNHLKKATQGLLYQSESDEPFQAFLWKAGGGPLTKEKLLSLSGHKSGRKVEEVKPEDFFADLTADQDWYGE
jgi:hypothetical protein